MEVPRLEDELELWLPVYSTATATQDLSHIYYGSRQRRILNLQRRILNLLSKARYGNCVLMDVNQIRFHWAMTGTPISTILSCALYVLHLCCVFFFSLWIYYFSHSIFFSLLWKFYISNLLEVTLFIFTFVSMNYVRLKLINIFTFSLHRVRGDYFNSDRTLSLDLYDTDVGYFHPHHLLTSQEYYHFTGYYVYICQYFYPFLARNSFLNLRPSLGITFLCWTILQIPSFCGGLLGTNSLEFYVLKNVFISPLSLKDIFA